MQNPQDEIPELTQMRLGVDYRFQIQVRGYKVTLRPLTIIEISESISNTVDFLTKLPVSARSQLVEEITLAKEKLALASTSYPGAGDPKLTDLVMNNWTADEIQYVFKQYVRGCDRCNPSLEEISSERLAEIVELVKKNPEGSRLALIELSFLDLVNLSNFLLANGN